MKLNKIALAVALAGGSMTVHMAAQADSVFYPYIVYGGAVTTVINVIDTVDPSTVVAGFPAYYNAAGAAGVGTAFNRLHYTLVSKIGSDVLDNGASCEDVNYYLPSSPLDLQTIDLGAYFTAPDDKGVMFNDPSINNNWKPAVSAALSYAMANVAGQGLAVRAYLVVDNADGIPPDGVDPRGTTIAGEAFIFDYIDGAAWGYRGFSVDGDGAAGAAGGAFGEYDYFNSRMPAGTPISFMPPAETTTRVFVTPLDNVPDENGVFGNHPLADPANFGQFVTDLRFVTGNATVYDRDENLVSGGPKVSVTCVGYADVTAGPKGLLSVGALAAVVNGGWGRLQTNWPSGVNPNEGDDPDLTSPETDAAHVIKLEFTASGVFNGRPAPGTFNNAFQLVETVLNGINANARATLQNPN